MISRRAQSIDSSGIRRVFDLAQHLPSPINLSIGQPDFDALPVVKEQAIKAIRNRKNSYIVTQGITELRAKIRQKYELASTDKERDVFVTSGVSGGILLSYMALLDPGDEILIPDPFFCMYRDLALLINAQPTYYDIYPDFSVSLERIEAAITPKTKAILVNSPANPTGYALAQNELDAIVEIAKRKAIWLIYDEIYEVYCYDYPHARCHLDRYDKTLILNGFSKSHGIPGWRLGFAVGPLELINAMLKIQQYSFVCAPAPLQWAMVEGMEEDLSQITAAYRNKRDLIYNGLCRHYDLTKPTGAFYIFPKIPRGNGQSFVERCVENNLLVVPGNVFSRRDTHFRISFSAPLEQLERGIEVLQKLAS